MIKTLLLLTPLVSAAITDWCFSPYQKCDHVVISRMEQTTTSLDVMIYGFTRQSIVDAVIRAHKRGIQVRILADHLQAHSRSSKKIREQIAKHRIPYYMTRGDKSKIFHHKALIADKKMVCQGSYNWTNGGTDSNNENLVCFNDAEVVKAFSDEFERLWIKVTEKNTE
jgi:mitochondrial cardiolipin hydrolase